MDANKEWEEIADRLWTRMEANLRHRQFKRLYFRLKDNLNMDYDESLLFFRWLYEQRIDGARAVSQEAKVKPKAEPSMQASDEASSTLDMNESDGELEIMSKGSICSLDGLVEAAKIDLSKWVVLEWSANTWEGFYRHNGEHRKVPMWQVKARLVPSIAANVSPAKSERVHVHEAEQPRHEGKFVKTCIVVPDTQHGFRWNDNRTKLIPMHDRRAIDCVVQLIEKVKPDLIVHLGDGPDFAEWSTKYPREPNLIETTQPAIEELHLDLRRMREASLVSKFIYLEGNHCYRIRSALIEKLPVALSTKAVGDSREALHLARLLSLDELGIEYVGPYKSYHEDWYWEDRVRFVHDGGVKGKGGQTVTAHLVEADCTTVFGHIHRLEMAGKTTNRNGKPKTIYAASAGCLCRLDGMVPAATPRVDWQHGCAVVYMTEQHEFVQTLPIHNGTMVWNGEAIIGADLGWKFAQIMERPVN